MSLDWLITGRESPFVREESNKYTSEDWLSNFDALLRKKPKLKAVIKVLLSSDAPDAEVLQSVGEIITNYTKEESNE